MTDTVPGLCKHLAVLLPLSLFVTGCTSTPNLSRPSVTPQKMIVQVAQRMQACWFKAKDPRFTKFRMAAEVNSFSGKPRVLIVPKNNPGGLPQLVVQAERVSGKNQLSTFGPLLQTASGRGVEADVRQWAHGRASC